MTKKQNKLTKHMGSFLKLYQRKAQRGVEPNDRRYDRNFEEKVKALPPDKLSELMHDDGHYYVPKDIEEKWLAKEPIEGISFGLNDSVSIKGGPKAENRGIIIALSRLIPEPEYYIELNSDNCEIKVFQSKLKKEGT